MVAVAVVKGGGGAISNMSSNLRYQMAPLIGSLSNGTIMPSQSPPPDAELLH